MCVWSKDSPSMAVHSGHLNFFRGVTWRETKVTPVRRAHTRPWLVHAARLRQKLLSFHRRWTHNPNAELVNEWVESERWRIRLKRWFTSKETCWEMRWEVGGGVQVQGGVGSLMWHRYAETLLSWTKRAQRGSGREWHPDKEVKVRLNHRAPAPGGDSVWRWGGRGGGVEGWELIRTRDVALLLQTPAPPALQV